MEIVFNIIKTMKMRKVKYIYWAGALILTLLISFESAAQKGKNINSPVSVELLKARALWFHTNNGAGLTFDNLYDFSDLQFNYALKSGDFKKKQDGENERVFGVSTQGGVKLGESYAWGSFAYNNEMQKGTLYNTMMLDFQRAVPYYAVDKNLSDWKKQNYELKMNVSSKPLWDRYFVGIQGEYVTKTGAKQIDPRSTVYYYTITLKPGIVAKFGNHAVGLNMLYQNLRQESGTTNSNSQVNQDVYVLKGLGNFYSAVVGGLQSLGMFTFDGNTMGGDIQYSYSSGSLSMLLNGTYSFRAEDVLSAPTKPKKEGSVKDELLSANLAIVKSGTNLSRLDLSYSSREISGIEYVQVLDNSWIVQRWVDVYSSVRSDFSSTDMSAAYSFFKGAAHEYKWRAGAFVNYRKTDDIYYIPESSMTIENFYMGADAKVNMALKGGSSLVAGAGVVYKNNLDGSYIYGGADPSSLVVTDFMTPDFKYMKQSYTKIGGELSYFTVVGKSRRTGMFFKITADYYKPSQGEGNRVFTNFGAGFTF